MAKASKFILIVGDEGGILVQMQGSKVVRRMYAPSTDYTDTRAMLEALGSDPKAPIYMVVDVMDQSYVQHSLPPVSSFSVKNLIKRKLERDFAAEDIKGALPIGREKEGRKDWKYLFVSLSYSPQLQAWMELVIDLPNRFKGIYLLPVESENFINELHAAITGRKEKKGKTESGEPRWRLLVAHNKVGGFRQVVLKDGKLVFARLAQPIGEAQPAVVAGSIEQEISVTIEYLKRLSYSPEQGLQLYVITSDAIKQSIDAKNMQATDTFILTPHEAATHLKMEDSIELGDKFADILLAVAFAKRKKHLLPLDTPASEKLKKMYGAIAAVQATAALLAVGAIGSLLSSGFQIPGINEAMDDVRKQISTAEIDLEKSKKVEADLPKDLDKITDLVAVYQILNNLGESPINALSRYRTAMGDAKLFIKDFSWVNEDKLIVGLKVDANASPKDPVVDPITGQPVVMKFEAPPNSLTITYVADAAETRRGTEGFESMAHSIERELAQQFENKYTVTIDSKLPGVQEDEVQEFEGSSNAGDPLLAQPSWPLNYKVVGPAEAKPADPNAPSGEAQPPADVGAAPPPAM